MRHPESFFAQPKNDEMQVLSARLGLSSANPVGEGVAAYSGLLESLAACWARQHGPRRNGWVSAGLTGRRRSATASRWKERARAGIRPAEG